MRNIEKFLIDTQGTVSGQVFVRLEPYRVHLKGISSKHDLSRKNRILWRNEQGVNPGQCEGLRENLRQSNGHLQEHKREGEISAVSIHQPLNHYQWGERCDGWGWPKAVDYTVSRSGCRHTPAKQCIITNAPNNFFSSCRAKLFLKSKENRSPRAESQGLQIKPGKRHRIINANRPGSGILARLAAVDRGRPGQCP